MTQARARRSNVKQSLLLVWSMGMLPACFGPRYPEGIPCSEAQTCPPGQSCDLDGVCRRTPRELPDPDAAVRPDASVPPTDAPVARPDASEPPSDAAIAGCTRDDQCPNDQVCGASGLCVDPGCDDGTRSGTETGVDCGGSCPPCDDNCDGFMSCAGTTLWAQRLGGTGPEDHADIAVDSAGNVLLTGQFYYTADFGGGPLDGTDSQDIFAVKLDAQGQHLWSRRLGGTGNDRVEGIATDSAGNVLITGSFSGTADFGGGPLSSAGSQDIFAVKIDAQGQHLWSRRFGGTNADSGTGVAADSAGNVLLTGYFEGTTDFGGGSLPSAGSADIFAVKLDAQGQHLWSRPLGGTSIDIGQGIAVDSADNVLLTGYCSGTTDFGGGPIDGPDSQEIFAVKLDALGQHLWGRRFGGTGGGNGQGIAVDSTGNVLLTGYFLGTVEFGGGPFDSAGNHASFVVELDAEGQHRWSHSFGGTGQHFGQDIALDHAGNVLFTGHFQGTANFGGGPLDSGFNTSDIFAVKLDAEGDHLWSRSLGGYGEHVGQGIAVDSVGNVLLTGYFLGLADYGGDPVESADYDVFAVKLTP